VKIEEVRSKSDSELEYDLERMKKELFDVRFKSSSEVSSNPLQARNLRRSIARTETILRERRKNIRGQEPVAS